MKAVMIVVEASSPGPLPHTCCTTGRNFMFAGYSDIVSPLCPYPPALPPAPPPSYHHSPAATLRTAMSIASTALRRRAECEDPHLHQSASTPNEIFLRNVG